jgi:hypothetical protein
MNRRLTKRFLAYLNRRNTRDQICISTGGTSISVGTPGGESHSVPWDGIARIVAFKRDVYGSDLICLLIEPVNGSVLEANEEMPGWADLVREVPIRLPSAKPYPTWFAEVAFPAFSVSPTSIFVRE